MKIERSDYYPVCVRDLLILKLLRSNNLNGWQLKRQLSETSGSVLAMALAPLYAALSRLEKKGFVVSESQRDDLNHRVKVYRLTASGHSHLEAEWERWIIFATAVADILDAPDVATEDPDFKTA